MRELLLIALVLACPLMVVWMMRGHGDHGHGAHRADTDGPVVDEPKTGSLAELRSRREAINAEIEQLERSETKTPARV